MSKLYRARSLLYRRQILQVNIRWKALDEIYKIYMLLHRSDLNISENFRQKSPAIFAERVTVTESIELSNEYLLAKFGFDTAENEPLKVC